MGYRIVHRSDHSMAPGEDTRSKWTLDPVHKIAEDVARADTAAIYFDDYLERVK